MISNMWNYIWPIGLVVLSNIFYNITTKSTPHGANAFLSLTITYLVAGACSFLAYFFTAGRGTLKQEFLNLNWTSFVLGLVIIGLEAGYIFAYRAGWKVNTAPLVANTILAIALIFVGFFLFKEGINLRHVIGIIVCLVGLIIINLK